MKIFKTAVITAVLGCPCQKVGENGFGRAFLDRSHPSGDLTMYHVQVVTPIAEEQIDDFKFVIQFSENIEVEISTFFTYFYQRTSTNFLRLTTSLIQPQISGTLRLGRT